ncbi:MAG: hypothetical protein RBR53_07825 [Desulforegulaceae bacterium]|nr:hypothetical protein [Desulforegulaceae bacterium]
MKKNLVFLVILFVFISCGYHFSGSGSLPLGIKKADVDIFENQTGFSGIDSCMRDEFIQEFSKYNIFATGKEAKGILKGEILKMSISNPVKKSSGGSYERRLSIVLNLRFVNLKGKVLFRRNNFSENYVFETNSDESFSFGVPYEDMRELCLKVSRRVVMELTSDF